VLSSQRFVDAANALTTGASYPAVTENQLFDLDIPLPSLDEQRRIIAEIASYQKVIDGARQILTGHKVRIDVEPEWPVKPLSEAAEIIGGYAFKSTEMKRAAGNGELPVLKIGNVGKDGRLDLTDIQYHALTSDLSRFLLHMGDIVIAMTGATVGKVAEVHRDNLLLNQRVGVLRRKQNAEQKYLLHLLCSPEFYDFCQRTAGGGAQGNIAPRQILDYEIPLPSLEEQRRVIAATDAEVAQMEAVRELIPKFEAKIQRVLNRVWGNGEES